MRFASILAYLDSITKIVAIAVLCKLQVEVHKMRFQGSLLGPIFPRGRDMLYTFLPSVRFTGNVTVERRDKGGTAEHIVMIKALDLPLADFSSS